MKTTVKGKGENRVDGIYREILLSVGISMSIAGIVFAYYSFFVLGFPHAYAWDYMSATLLVGGLILSTSGFYYKQADRGKPHPLKRSNYMTSIYCIKEYNGHDKVCKHSDMGRGCNKQVGACEYQTDKPCQPIGTCPDCGLTYDSGNLACHKSICPSTMNPMDTLCKEDKAMLAYEYNKMVKWYSDNPNVPMTLSGVCAEFGKYVADNVCGKK